MPQLTINGISLDVPANTSLLEAAASMAVSIPTLCHAPGKRPLTSCMICVVEDTQKNRLLPACSAKVEEGMTIETDSDKVQHARRAVLELLLSEHLGDCEAPCERACPAGLNIPLMLRRMARGETNAARMMARQALVLPAILGRICTAPCEAGCRRGSLDEPVAIRELHGQPGEMLIPVIPADSGKKVAVIGTGPAGLAAAFVLRSYGHSCRVYDKKPLVGGSLCAFSEQQLPRDILEEDINHLVRMGIEFVLDTEVGTVVPLDEVSKQCDAVVVACALAAHHHPDMFHVEKQRMPVRSIASGKSTAETVHAYLLEIPKEIQPDYHSIMGRVTKEHIAAFADHRTSDAALSRSRNAAQPREEAERCLHCDCHAPISCKLRQYAAGYGAHPKVFRNAERPLPSGIKRHGNVIFDKGKCIKCGLCVEVTKENREPFGMAFTGRGFNMQVKIPFGESLEKALTQSAEECVALCPTGALAFETKEERIP